MWELKLDEHGHVVLKDGKPLYVNKKTGQESALDINEYVSKVTALNKENMERRQENNELKEKLDTYGDLDPDKARVALKTMENLQDKELLEADKVEELKDQINQAYESKLQQTKDSYEARLREKDKVLAGKDQQIHRALIESAFLSSEYIRQHMVIPEDIAYKQFGENFKVEEYNGKPIAVGYIDDSPVYSLEKPGELAKFEEAIQLIVDKYPLKDRILKGADSNGEDLPPTKSKEHKVDLTNAKPVDRIKAGLLELKR